MNMDLKSNNGNMCGFGPCVPSWLQPLADIRAFVVMFGILGMFSWALWTLAVSQLTNIEKAFGLNSAETGWLLTIFELGFLVCTVTSSHFTTNAHVPRVIGIFVMISGVSGLVMSIPHFFVFANMINETSIGIEVKYEKATNELNKYLCINLTQTNATDGDHIPAEVSGVSEKTIAYVIFCIALGLQGVAKGPCTPYSSQYIDDNGEKRKTGFYVGIATCISIFGMVMGYGIGSGTSNFYVTMKDTELKSTDSLFIGAWWLGFITMGFVIILFAIPMFCFPRKLKKINNSSVRKINVTTEKRQDFLAKNIKVACSSILYIVRQPIYTLTLAASCFQVLAIACFIGFEPKYMETQFAVPSWKANMILGVASIGAYSIGSLVGGYTTKKFKMSAFRILLVIVCLWFVVIVLNTVAIFIGCPQQDIINPREINESVILLPSVCDCLSTQFIPICGNDSRSYYSPCDAGCHNVTSEIFTNCVSIPGGMAKFGMCPTACIMLWIYTATMFSINVCDATTGILLFLIFLRVTGESHKAIAVALSGAMVSLTGWMPGPIIGGKLVDHTCLIWNTAPTGSQYCGYYNTEQQRYYVNILKIGLRVVAMSLLLMTLYKARNMKEWLDNSDRKQTNATDSDDVEQRLSL